MQPFKLEISYPILILPMVVLIMIFLMPLLWFAKSFDLSNFRETLQTLGSETRETLHDDNHNHKKEE